ncbi:MAG TPA: hypothetical protein VH518_10170 [Tepidisphaeraceae bacterium]
MSWRNPILWVGCSLLILVIGLFLAVLCAESDGLNLPLTAVAAQVIVAGTILFSWSLEIVAGKRPPPIDRRRGFRVVEVTEPPERPFPREEQPPASPEPIPEALVAPHPPASPTPPLPP